MMVYHANNAGSCFHKEAGRKVGKYGRGISFGLILNIAPFLL